MKNILIYVSVVLLILGSLITVLIFNKKDINDSVVYIESIDEETIRSGSGFVYKIEDGTNYIVTSYHVIEGFNDIYVYNTAKEKIKANILNYDEYTDIAILTIEDSLDLKEISVGDSDKVNVNDKIFVIGSPIGISNINTKVEGSVLFVNRMITIPTTHGGSSLNSIEVNAKVDKGNSGGVLLNKNNQVIGMMFAKESAEVSYALPINFVINIVQKLVHNELKRPNLGAIMCNTSNTELLNEYNISIDNVTGVVVLNVNDSYPIDNAELKEGDIITKFNEIEISDVNVLREELYKKSIGDSVPIEYYRNGRYYKIIINL